MESIKTLLESWQNTLNTVINSKLSILNVDPRNYEMVSQEAMGDYSKPNVGSDDDSGEISNDYDEGANTWTRNYPCNFDDYPETPHSGDYADPPDFSSIDMKYGGSMQIQCECKKLASNVLFILPEETSSQVAIEEVVADHPETDPLECQNAITTACEL